MRKNAERSCLDCGFGESITIEVVLGEFEEDDVEEDEPEIWMCPECGNHDPDLVDVYVSGGGYRGEDFHSDI